MNQFLILFSVLFIFFLPGFFLSLVFFKWKAIDSIERLILSFGISTIVVSLIMFYNNLFGGVLTAITVLTVIATMLLLVGIILGIQHLLQKDTV